MVSLPEYFKQTMSGTDNKAKDAILKVKGWLLFLCINMVIVNPLWQIVTLANTYIMNDSMGIFEAGDGLETIFYINLIFQAFFVYKSIQAGLGLVNVRTGAVAAAKKFLRNYASYFVFLLGLTIVLAPGYFDLFSVNIIASTARSLMIIGIGYLYLSYSKKVKEIYPA